MQAELCLFDLDGTLLDTQNDYLAADRYMRGVYELEPLPMKVAVQLASAGLRAVIKAAFLNTHGKMPADELVEEAYQLNIKYYMEHIADHAQLYPGVKRVLQQLQMQGKVLAVVSNKNTTASEKLLKLMDLAQYFSLIAGDDANMAIKPAPDMLWYAMDKLGFTPAETVMVGDNFTDIEAARRAGIRSIFFSNGYGSLQDEKADAVIGSMDEILNVIE